MQKLCLITGGGTGIGAALALQLAKRDLHVLITGRTKSKLQATQSRDNTRISALVSDVSKADDRQKVAEFIKGRFELTYVVHNAAVIEPIGMLKDMRPEAWRKHQAVNLEGPLFLTQTLLPLMSSGRILNISSGAAHRAIPGWGAYCMSKAALYMLYKLFKEEYSNSPVLFGSVRPGVVDTPMQEVIRAVPESDFPGVQNFISMKQENMLVEPDTVGRFLAWVLCESDDERFEAEEWDIRDEDHQRFWKE